MAGLSIVDWAKIIGALVGVCGFVFAIYQYIKAKKRREAKKAEEEYKAALKKELGHIDLLGSPDIEYRGVELDKAFVSLRISESWRSDERFGAPVNGKKKSRKSKLPYSTDHSHLSPEQVIKQAFLSHNLLLIIGDPGSGKTTLIKYYVMKCLNRKHRQLGFHKKIFPVFFPLREMAGIKDLAEKDNEPLLLYKCLHKWAQNRQLTTVTQDHFKEWLTERDTLVLLDGLDEIGSLDRRIEILNWINLLVNGLRNAKFVLTSRATGYRKMDNVQLKIPHLRADIMDFTPHQQKLFLQKWFRAAYCTDRPHDCPPGWEKKRESEADLKSSALVEFLNRESNRAVRDLAAVPILLQIMAVIWEKREYMPETRSELYHVALNYILEHRDKVRNIPPPLSAAMSRRVLAPAAFWMHSELKQDEALKTEMHDQMQPVLDTLDKHPDAADYCAFLRDRAGLIADYDKDHYIFRHKSFREYLASFRLREQGDHKYRSQLLAGHFKEDWWEETLRFVMGEADDQFFDQFVEALFRETGKWQLNDHQQNLLLDIVKEAPQKRIDALTDVLNRDNIEPNQRRYALGCLKVIGSKPALQAIENYAENNENPGEEENRSYAWDIHFQFAGEKTGLLVDESGQTIRNPFEDYVEYIKIPGGRYIYSVTEKKVTVPDLYFCKYMVTNKRYRRFIDYLKGDEKKLNHLLPLSYFSNELKMFAKRIDGFIKFLGADYTKWHERFRSKFEDDKRFNAQDQPVVAISWYAARAYCFWLSCLKIAAERGEHIVSVPVDELAGIYRLPTEEEWEWAAYGNPDGTTREFPWPVEKGKPSPELANYGENVGFTTPVGRYPDGATPLGLMDMAGNAWEWMENFFDKDNDVRAMRGGSWSNVVDVLRCSVRGYSYPRIHRDSNGFRPLLSQSLN